MDCCSAELDAAGELDRLHENRPGLPALSYRLGRHGDFFSRMLNRLPNERNGAGIGSAPPLGRLTYRGQDDATIALLDACSSLLDVLAFYQERVANEAFIRTALERRSVLELARSIGYEMRPGVAASTLLAFDVDDAPGSPERVIVPVGTQVLSIPKKDELPQTFETIEPMEARVEWNRIGVQMPRTMLSQSITTGSTHVFLSRQGPRLSRGDVVLLVGRDAAGAEHRLLRRVHRATDVPARGYRHIEFQSAGSNAAGPVPLVEYQLFSFGLRTRFFGQNAPSPDGRVVEIKRLLASAIQTPVRCVALASRDSGLGASGFEAVLPDPGDGLAASVARYQDAVVEDGLADIPDDKLVPQEPTDEPSLSAIREDLLAEIDAAGQAVEDGLQARSELLRQTIRIWNIDDASEVRALAIESTITALAFSTDDVYLAATTHEGGEVRLDVWDVSTGASVASHVLGATAQITQPGPVVSIAFQASGGGAYRITTIDATQRAVLWDFTPMETQPLTPTEALDLSILGDLVGDPRHVEDGDRSLVGDEHGVTTYRARQILDVVPETVVLEDGRFDLDGVYRKLVPGGWVLFDTPDGTSAYRIEEIETRHRSDFGITKRVSRLRVALDAAAEPPELSRRETEIHAESDALTPASVEVTLPMPIAGSEVLLADALEGLEGLEGRTVIVQGRPIPESAPAVGVGSSVTVVLPDGKTISLRVTELYTDGKPRRLEDEHGFAAELPPDTELVLWDEDADLVYEVAKVELVNAAASPPTMTFVEALQRSYDWRSVRILGNVAPATHGETVTEVLGSGDGLARNQQFKLGKPPLTFVPAPGVTGRQSTLEVRVNGVLWEERESLLQVAPADEVFIVRIQDDGKTEIAFGDGRRGARLPSGAENVVATYRSGLGAEGEVEAGQLALLKTKPLGIREVTNPLPAAGAASPEAEAEARENAPRTVLVLGRVVSIQDYEDFSRSFPGVGKAQAVAMWDGFSRLVHLTVGTAGGAPIEKGLPLYDSLLGALDAVRDTHQVVVIEGYEDRYFGLCAGVLVDPRYQAELVLPAIESRLREAFSYPARNFGQDVSAAEIMAVIHEVPGVVAVDLDALYFVDEGKPDGAGATAPTQRLEARLAYLDAGKPRPAELLLIDPTRIEVKEMT